MVCFVEVVDGRQRWVFKKRPLSLSRRAVERRVRHRLVGEGLILRKCSPRSRWYRQLGDYYLVRVADRFIVGSHSIRPSPQPGVKLCFLQATHQFLDDLAREYGVIAEGQTIVDE